MNIKNSMKKGFTLGLLLFSLFTLPVLAQDDVVLLDETVSDKIMPVVDSSGGYAVIFYTYVDGDALSVRTANYSSNGIGSNRNTIATGVVKSSGESVYFNDDYDMPANWYAAWHRKLEQYLLVYATSKGVFARRVQENGSPKGGPKKVMSGSPVDNLVVVQTGTKNYILFYKKGMQTYAQLLKKTGAKQGNPKQIAGGVFFGDTTPLSAVCDSKTNVTLFYGTLTLEQETPRFSASMYRTNKALNPMAHMAFSSIAKADLYPGILAANSREDERYFAVWPCKPMDVKYKDNTDEVGRVGYSAIGTEDGGEIVFDDQLSGNVEFGGIAANQVTGNFQYMFAYKNSQDSKLELFTGTISKNLELIDQDSFGVLPEPIHSMAFSVTDFGTKLVCYSITEDGTAKTYVKIKN